jgi:homoserine dehydrogenase
MTRTISVLQLGAGQVGSAVVRVVASQASRWLAEYDLAVGYHSLADSSAFILATGESREYAPLLFPDRLSAALEVRAAGQRFASFSDAVGWPEWKRLLDDVLERSDSPEDVVVLDCASGSATTLLLLAARAAGAHVVLANKDPLVGSMAQFRALSHGNGLGSLHISATVGAGLPVLATLRALTASGDHLLELGAQASGSLGFICSALSDGVAFDAAVREAVSQGYTEPDARQDLSGFDVARKLLILARTAGAAAEASEVVVESLVPPGAQELSVADFTAALSSYSNHLAERIVQAQANKCVLRYVARIDKQGALSASLRELPPDDPLARGRGPDNVFLLRTSRYRDRPLVIAGPGAGIDVTAGAVVADLLRAIGAL